MAAMVRKNFPCRPISLKTQQYDKLSIDQLLTHNKVKINSCAMTKKNKSHTIYKRTTKYLC